MRRAACVANLAGAQREATPTHRRLRAVPEAAPGTEEIHLHPRLVISGRLFRFYSLHSHALLCCRTLSDLADFAEIEAGAFANLTHLRTM